MPIPLLLQSPEVKPLDWVTIILVVTNVLGPIFTFLATRRQYSATAEDSETKTSFLKLDKVVQLMDKVESAQDKYLKLRDQHSRLEQRTRQMEATYADFYDDVKEVFAIVKEVCEKDKVKHSGILSRLERIEKAGAELKSLKLSEQEGQES